VNKIIYGAASALFLFAGLSGCGGDSDSPPDVYQEARANGFTDLVAAVDAAGLKETLEAGNAQYTVFAPTNAAFEATATQLGFTSAPAMIAALPPTALASLLKYHVLGQRESASMLNGMTSATTLYTVNGAGATLALSATGGLSITDADLTTAHVTTADVAASNGVIHVVDKVLVPPSLLNVVQMASLNAKFTTLVGAVKSAGLETALSGTGPFTVFAPTNDAFAAIQSTVAALDTAQLTTVLEYHVVGQAVAAADIPFGQPIATLANQNITINSATPPTITDTTETPARIVATDVKASNGIIHVIDKVLIPAL
jgi:transforming growth factor-beta-induced protein